MPRPDWADQWSGSSTGTDRSGEQDAARWCCACAVDATERAGQKIILQRQLADLRLHILHTRALRLSFLRRRQEHAHRTVEQLRLPLHDLTGMDIELLRQLGQGLVALERGQR